MRILVMGAGAVGSYFGARLQQAGETVVFCARGAHLGALKQDGLQVTSLLLPDFALRVMATAEPREFAPYDLVLFCVKSYDTLAAARQAAGCLAEGGAIMTLQNGVENEAALCTVFPPAAVMGGNAWVGAEVVAPGRVLHTAAGMIDFGELDGRETPRALKLAESLRRAGILGRLITDLKTARWSKLMNNNGTNGVCALARCTVGEALADPDGRALVRRLMLETVAAGRAEGARLREEDIDAQLAQMAGHPAAAAVKPSTLQDLERGRRLEYDAISGAVIRTARRHGIEAPATAATHALLKLLDQGARRPS